MHLQINKLIKCFKTTITTRQYKKKKFRILKVRFLYLTFLDFTVFTKLSNKFVEALSLALDDIGTSVEDHEHLFDLIEESFIHIVRLSSTVTQGKGPASKLIGVYVDSLHKKLEQVAEVTVMALDPDLVTPTKQQLFGAQKKVLEKVQGILAAVFETIKNKKNIIYHAAHLLISFALRVVSPAKIIRLETDPLLNIQLCQIANQLFNPSYNKHFLHDCQLLLSFIENAPNFDRESFTKKLIDEKNYVYSKIYILSILFKTGQGCDTNLRKFLIDMTEKIIFNDKHKEATDQVQFFEPFFSSIDENIYMSEIHSNTQFCVNRSGILLNNIAHMISYFSFKLSSETAIQLSYSLISKDQILGQTNDVKNIFKAVCQKVSDPVAFSNKIIGHLISEYEKVKQLSSVGQSEKYKILDLACSCANYLNVDAEACITATVDLILNMKEPVEISKDVNELIKRCGPKVSQQLSNGSQKISQSSQIQILIECRLFDSVNVIMGKFSAINFEVIDNISMILSMMRLISDSGLAIKLLDFEGTTKFLLNPSSQLNQPGALKRLNNQDIENHLKTIQSLMNFELKQSQAEAFEKVLIEYICNNDYIFRANHLWACFQSVQKKWSEKHLVQILTQVFTRIHKLQTEKISEIKQSQSISQKVRNFLSFVIPRGIKLEQETLFSVLQVVCHPLVSPNQSELRINTDYIVKISKMPLKAMIEDNIQKLILQFLKERTGILCPDPTVRQIGINVLAIIGSVGLLSKFLPEMMPIFNYKPVEFLDKLEKLLVNEFDRISHYDLMFYAEMTRDMIGMYQDKDKQCIAQSLHQYEDQNKEETKAEVNISAEDDMDPAILAMLAKSSKKKKGKQPPAQNNKPAPTKPVATKIEVPEISKQDQNKLDRKQMLNFVTKMREVKGQQIKACYDVLTLVNQYPIALELNYQEITLAYLTIPLLKLLNLVQTRFDSTFFIQNLLNENKSSPFFKIKGFLLQGLIAVADNKLTNRSINDISTCLQNLTQNADFSEMGVGSLKICLTIANFVLKDPSVNLSVKEIGLNVAQSILMENNVVQNIDLVRLTINMLKTNYISHNLNGFIRKLIRRTNKIEIALLLQPLFEYQPIPRKVLLNELYQYDEPLFNPVWFSSQIWILLYDEELGGLARKIFNKFGLALRYECLDISLENQTNNIFHYLRSSNFGVFQLTTKAVGSAIEIHRQSPKLKKIFDDIIVFYQSEWRLIEEEARVAADLENNSSHSVQQRLRSDQRINRICAAQIFDRTAKLIQPQHFESVLTFLVTESCQDQNEEVKEASRKASVAIIKAQGEENANQLLQVLEIFLNANEGPASSDASKNQAVVLLGYLAQFLGDTAQKKLVTSYEKLVDLLLKSSPNVQRAICKCIPQLARFFPEKAKVYLTNQLIILRQSKDEKVLKASSFAIAGLIKSLGMQYSVEIDLLNIIEKECFESKKTEPIRKQAGCYLYDAMSFSMGHSFEVYLPKIFPSILTSISDQKEPVRNAALAALKTIMGIFSNYAIKQALPQFLIELQNDNWRSKYSTVEALGNMAFCAPKQISSFLPQIVKGLREVLNDTHEQVHKAAIEAIKKIGSVIKCPEIGDMLEIIIKALANTNTHLNEALKLILETSFAHAIDAPSLSLLVPLLDAGLTMHDNQSKRMAATLMGNICSLTQDPQDLLPYMQILVPAIKNSLFDAIPEIRGSAAKALGRLSRGLGVQQSHGMLAWLREHLDKANITSSEKSGAAQGYAEMISSHGKDYFENYITEVISKAQDTKNSYLRENYRGVLVFLPGCFDKYVDYLSMLIPIMIEGLADDLDEVRKISMRNVKICIKQFAKTNPSQLVTPVMRMMFSIDWKVRESSSVLMFQLIKELENDVIKATPTYIDQDTKHRILSSMFILRYDPIDKVCSQASQIWKNLIDNPLMILRQVIDTCIHIIFQIIQSPSGELQEMGLSCIRGIVEKMGEKLVGRAIEIFEHHLEMAVDKTQSLGVCRVLYNMAGSASYRLLQVISPKLVSILDPYLSAESEELREWSSKVFITLFQRQSEKTFVDPILDKSILVKLKSLILEHNEQEAERLITTLQYMVEKAPGLKIEDRMLVLCDVQDKQAKFSIAQARIIKALASTFAGKVFTKKFYYQVLLELQEELKSPEIDDQERIQHVLMAYSEILARIPEVEVQITNDEIERFLSDCRTLTRPGFFLDMIAHYCKYTLSNFEKLADQYMENILKYINYPDDNLVTKVINAINSIMEKLPKENQMMLVPSFRKQIEVSGVQVISTLHSLQRQEGNLLQHFYKKKSPILTIFKSLQGIQSIVNYVQAAIMHGSVSVRIDAAFTLKYVLEFSDPIAIKKEIIKICGALIRVVNDKFPQDLKMQIFFSLQLIQMRYADSAKAMAAQLQTTFLKALGDSQTNIHVQRIVIENLILLVKGQPRVDPIIKELVSLLQGDKIDGQQKELVAETLALLIRAKGKAITSTMSEQVANSLHEILSTANQTGLNDIVLANTSVALAYLSAYAASPDQMVTMFNTFNGRGPISVGIKFGVLTNGNETIDKSKMAKELQTLLVGWLESNSGFDQYSPFDDQDVYKFSGAFELIGHLTNSFGRREWCQAPNSPYLALMFNSINLAKTIKNQLQSKQMSQGNFALLLKVMAQIPVKSIGDKLSNELGQLLKDSFDFIQAFYLDHADLNAQCTDTILNMLQLTYDNFLDVQNIRLFDRPYVKEMTQQASLVGVISEDMKLYALDIVFKKK